MAKGLKVEMVDLFNCSWLKLSEAELRKRLRTMADGVRLEQLREVFALLRARDL